MDHALTRRSLLAATTTGVAVGLAGCLGTRDGPVPEPTVTDDRIDDGWRLVDESSGEVFEDDVGPVTITALERTLLYEHVGVAEAVADAFDAEGSPVLFFASRIDLRPALDGLPFGIGRGQVMDEVETAADAAFREQLRDGGIEGIEEADPTSIEVDTGHEATVFQYVGHFSVDGEVELAQGVTETISDEIEIEGQLAVWHDGTDVLLAGGVYPTEPLDAALDDAIEDGSVDLGDVVGGDAAETLSRDPASFEDEVDALMVSVE